ncbi:hypothetical protein MKS88_004843 [Plasmodium brasilianum]|uniref:Uncharacterized protein n=1 Tax=Plasmodium brasilianum TaxID=5824 RepID=A0ACB9Y4Z4_PLABR|nr:hypothetical protein MKS88_004843 [Plasmodium brasilianum]
MLRLQQINRTNYYAYRMLLCEEKNRINVSINEYKDLIPNNNSKTCKNKYKNFNNLHNIIQSGVLKNYKNVYFYKNLLRIAENRKNYLSLHQINIILKSLIKAKIYRYSLFNSFEIPILKYVSSLSIIINSISNKDTNGGNITNNSNIIHSSYENNFNYKNNIYRKLHLNEAKYKFIKSENNIHFLHIIISDQLTILVHIFRSYMDIFNFHFYYLYETLFFFITKNYLYLNEKEIVRDIWTIYLTRVLCNGTAVNTKNEPKKTLNIIQQITVPTKNVDTVTTNTAITTTASCSTSAVKYKGFQRTMLYRHNCKCNIYVKTVCNYALVVLKNVKKKNNKRKKEPYYYNTIFCKKNIRSICKYVIMLILKNEKLAIYFERKKKKKKNADKK